MNFSGMVISINVRIVLRFLVKEEYRNKMQNFWTFFNTVQVVQNEISYVLEVGNCVKYSR